jgi:hypothetical protein
MSVPYCFKFGDYQIPNEYIEEGGYECAPSQRQDVEPWTDANGLTHRNVVPHRKSEVNITFRQLNWAQFTNLITGLTSNYISEGDRDATCTYLNMGTMTLTTGHFYLDPSCKFKVRRLNQKVNSFSLKFTEY